MFRRVFLQFIIQLIPHKLVTYLLQAGCICPANCVQLLQELLSSCLFVAQLKIKLHRFSNKAIIRVNGKLRVG